MAPRDIPRDGETEPGSGGLGAEEWLEDALRRSFRDRSVRIFNLHQDLGVIALAPD